MGLRKSLHHFDSSKYLIAFTTGARLLLLLFFLILYKDVPSEKLHGRIRIMSQITTSTCVHCTASTTMKPTCSTSFCPLDRSAQQLLETSQFKCDVGAAPEHLHIPHQHTRGKSSASSSTWFYLFHFFFFFKFLVDRVWCCNFHFGALAPQPCLSLYCSLLI